MGNKKIAMGWLKVGEKVRPKCWREECFIFWDENSMCCRDEDEKVIDISKFDEEDWEIYKEKSHCEKCGKEIKTVIQTVEFVKEYERILSVTGYKILCDACLLKLKEEIKPAFCLSNYAEKDKDGHFYLDVAIKKFIEEEREIIDKAHFENWSLTKTFKELDKLAGPKLK